MEMKVFLFSKQAGIVIGVAAASNSRNMRRMGAALPLGGSWQD